MKHLTKNVHWLKLVIVFTTIAAASTQLRAADREDVVAGVLIGATAGYILSEHNDNVHIAYRQSNRHWQNDRHSHQHHPKCKHRSHFSQFYPGHYSDHHPNYKHHAKYAPKPFKREWYSKGKWKAHSDIDNGMHRNNDRQRDQQWSNH